MFDDLGGQLRFPLASGATDGFREAQVAAVHAIVAHFWDQRTPAIAVMPTGSGKTAVMLAAAIALRAKRVLVVAPSRLLREQLVEKFSTLDPLRPRIGALDPTSPAPNVVEIKHKLSTKGAWNALRASDVVIGTPMTMSPKLSGIATPPSDLFDTIFFDEAHHVPAPSYTALAAAFPNARQVLFTATPFRGDEKELPGDLVFTYELARARADGVFGKLRFSPVEPKPGKSPDEAIALAAAAQLVADKKAGLAHRIVVRTSGMDRANELAKLYKRVTKLDLPRVHSGLSAKAVGKAIDDLKAGAIDGVIAVDMLGEGFDLPNLKIAALHTPHKSLAITLQFIGRFARTTGENLGEATFFAIANEVQGEAERLFVPGAEWNEIVEDLSQQRISGEKEVREVIAGFETEEQLGAPLSDERINGFVWSLRPLFHAKVYEVFGTVDLEADLDLPRGATVLFTRRNLTENLLVCVTEQRSRLRWSTDRSWNDRTYDLFVIIYVPAGRHLFVCTTRRQNAVYDQLIDSVAKRPYRRLAPGEINRVIKDLQNAEFFGLGMRNRAGTGGAGAEAYRILAGRSADKALRAQDATLYDQGHAFVRGTEGGKSTVIGFSTGSKVWSSQSGRITELLGWARGVSKKLQDTKKATPKTMFDNLGVASRVDTFPQPVIAAEIPVEAYSRPTAHIHVGNKSVLLLDLSATVGNQTSHTVDIEFSFDTVRLQYTLDLRRQKKLSARNQASKSAELTDASERHSEPFLDFLNEHSPILYLSDLSSVQAELLSAAPAGDPAAVMGQIEAVDWSALNVDPYTEKPPGKAGRRSLFEYVRDLYLGENVDVLFSDDSSQEIADFVAVRRQPGRVLVQLAHCKAASKPKKKTTVPNDRVDDLYEVLGQAVKCRRWLQPKRLLDQIRGRATRTVASRFLKGDSNVLATLFANPTEVAFEIVIVQPALSTTPKDTIADLISAADAYHRGAALLPIRFVGTAPPP